MGHKSAPRMRPTIVAGQEAYHHRTVAAGLAGRERITGGFTAAHDSGRQHERTHRATGAPIVICAPVIEISGIIPSGITIVYE